MKEFFKKIVMGMLSCMLCVSAAACAGKTKDPAVTTPQDPPTGTIAPSLGDEVKGTHEISVSDGTADFVKDGKSDYRIVVPKTPSHPNIEIAARELNTFVMLATGVSLPIVTDDTVADASKIISVGETAALANSGITVDKDTLTRSGYRILTKGDSVYLIGGGDLGDLYAAYGFLEAQVGLRVYTKDEIYVDTATSLKLKTIDITDIPDFTYRMASFGTTTEIGDITFARRMRLNRETCGGEIWMGPDSRPWHNVFNYLNPDVYKADHPLWYSTTGEQLCFLAHGDEAEKEALFREFFKNFLAVVEANPNSDNITISANDINVWCNCDACVAERTKYGTDSATVIKFCNRVSDELAKYFEDNHIDRKVNIGVFAYHKIETPPVKRAEDGSWEPIDESVICRDNVFVFYCPVFARFVDSFYDASNKAAADNVDAWSCLTNKVYLWIYSANFNGYFDPFNSFDAMQGTYRFLKSRNVVYLFDQAQWNNKNLPGFCHLKQFLYAQMQWDVNRDPEALINEFAEHYWKQAAAPMKKLLDYWRTYNRYAYDVLKAPYSLYSSTYKADFYPKGVVDTFLSLIDDAYKAIEPLAATDPTLYTLLEDRITLEALSFRYMDIEMYGSKYAEDELAAMKQAFKADALRLGINKWKESGTIDDLWTRWNI